MASLFERRLAESRIRSRALIDELAHWRKSSEAGQPLEKHRSQVRRIAAVIEGLVERLNGELEGAAPGELGRLRSAEEGLLTAHSIWDFFRSKLAQRFDGTFRDHLRVCDELAWACYAPARERFLKRLPAGEAGTAGKEPPLVFLNAGWSPFAMGRDGAFEVDRTAGGWLAQADFREVVERLPVPLIGLPWYQVAHLPDVLVVAHEVGHIVEWDFGLRGDLRAAIRGLALPSGQPDAWLDWQPEVFADLYGCLACGGAFAAELVDFLAQDAAKVAAERRVADRWGLYPPAWLRVRVLEETLRLLDRASDADALAERWKETYGEPVHHRELAPDARPVAEALLKCPCASLGATVREILTPLVADPGEVARNLARGYGAGSGDTRVLLAAARRLWELDADAYVTRNASERIRVLVKTPPGTRRGSAGGELVAREAADRQTGADLFGSLFPKGG